MDWLNHVFGPLGAYPRWFVIVCIALAAIGIGWVLAKLIKWTIYVGFVLVLLGVILFVAAWLWG